MRAFYLRYQDLSGGWLKKFMKDFSPDAILAMPNKRDLVGGVDFGIAKLLSEGKVALESPEFRRFSLEFRSTPGALALMSLANPDYGLVCIASASNAALVRKNDNLDVQIAFQELNRAVYADAELARKFCEKTGLLPPFHARHCGGMHLYLTRLYVEFME